MTNPNVAYSRRLVTIVAAILAVAVLLGIGAGTVALAEGGIAASSVKAETPYDDDIAKAEKDKAAKEAELKELKEQLQETDDSIVDVNEKLKELEGQLPAVQAALDEAEERLATAELEQQRVATQLDAAEAQDKALTDQIEQDSARVTELQNTVAALARDSYRGAGDQDQLSLVFGSTSTDQFIDDFAVAHSSSRVQSNALTEMEDIAAVNRNRGARQEAVREFIQTLKDEADALVKEMDAAKADAEDKRNRVKDLVDQQAALKQQLEVAKQTYLDQQAQIEADHAALSSSLTSLMAKRTAYNSQQGKLTKGVLGWPTNYRVITSSYGMRFHPILQYSRMHWGTDMRAYCGTPIYAAADGKVQWAQNRSGYGRQVMLDSGDYDGKSLFTSYNHLSSFAVSTGQTVKRGQIVGYAGTSGTSTGCHLHFEAYADGKNLDPMSLID